MKSACGALAFVAIALTFRRWWCNTAAIDAVYYAVHPVRNPVGAEWFVVAAAAATILVLVRKRLARSGEVLFPALLFYPLLILPPGFPALAGVLAVTGWCLYRALQWKCALPPLSPRAGVIATAALSFVVAGWSFFIQNRAFSSLFLAYSDWGEYAECYLKLASGQTPWSSFLAQAGHFNPLPNILMSGLLRCFPSPAVIFLTGAMCLGALPGLSYRLARLHRLPPGAAVGCAAMAAFNPVLINQSLSLFYGFHPVLFLGPLILAWFIFCAGKNRAGMVVVFATALLVQETAAVFFAGYALKLLLEKKYLSGAALGLLCLVVFAVVSYWIMPAVLGGSNNPQMFHFAQLGDSPLEVVLSPLLRPRAFFDTLLQRQNLYFTAALLLPVGALALRAPLQLATGIPLLAGVLLQQSVEVKNPAMQYGFELSLITIAAAVAGAGELLRSRKRTALPQFRGGVRCTVIMTLLCSAFWGRLPSGKYPASEILKRPDATGTIRFLRRCSEPGGRVLSTRRLRLYHMFDRRTAPLDSSWESGDTIILDLHDGMEPVDLLRRRLAVDPRAIPVSSKNFYGRQFAIWRIAPPGTPRPPLPFIRNIPEENFQQLGLPLPQDNPDFAARLTRSPRNTPVLLLRLLRKVAYDVEINLSLRLPQRTVTRRLCFGDGVYPAWSASPGETYLLELPDADMESIIISLTPRR